MIDWTELLNWGEYAKLLIGLLALTDPLGLIPVFQSLTHNYDQDEKKRVANVAVIAFVVTMLFFTFLGDSLLNFFGITIPAFRVAGGILLLLMGLDMMRGSPNAEENQQDSSEGIRIAIVPLAIPLLAGPGAISTIVIYKHLHESFSHLLLVSGVVVSIGVVVLLALRMASVVESILGKTGMQVFNRAMGLIVAAIGVEFMMDGIGMHFPELFQFETH